MKFTVDYPIVLAGYDPVLVTPQAGFMQRPGSAEEHRDHLGQLADAGVDSFVVRPPAPLAGSVEPG
jgi:hypothetical protein